MEWSRQRDREIATALGVGATFALALWYAWWTGPRSPVVWPADLLLTLFSSLPIAMAWFLAASGYGWALRLWLLRGAENAGPLQVGLGVAAMLVLDALLGGVGVLDAGGGAAAYGTIAVGIILLAAQFARAWRAASGEMKAPLPHPVFWFAAPAIAALVVASCSAPGWLWESEFGGYDALSYHLQLPKEWLALGRIEPLEHNVYSFLPGYVEAAYYHLALLRGDAIESACAAQLLHATIAIAAAWATGRFVSRIAALAGEPKQWDWIGAMAALVVLGTPWIIVVGSLAYNEMFVVLFFACAMLVAADENVCPRRRGVAIGILAGAAVGAKLTAAGFVVLPIGALMIATLKPRQWLIAGALAAISCAGVLMPYLVRNCVAAGNPVFPFATEVFGRAHWSLEQVQIWRDAHRAELSFGGYLGEAWNQLMRFGYGKSPIPEEPWKPQWSILWWLGPLAAALTIARGVHTRMAWWLVAALTVQIVFWLGFTHLKSRFLLPAVVPLAGLLVLAPCALLPRSQNPQQVRRLVYAMLLFMALWPIQSALTFRTENGGAPAARIGGVRLMTGALHSELLDRAAAEQARRDLLATARPSLYINFLLPRESRTLLVGDATPFYFTGDIVYQTTWDRGPISEALRSNSDPLEHIRARGFTHILVNLGMLERWERAGWSDPLLTASAMIEMLDGRALLLRAWEDGAVRLYDLDEAPLLR